MKKIVVSGLVTGVVIFVVSMALSQLINIVFPTLPKEYVNGKLFRPWTDPLMLLYFLYPFLLGLVLSWAWSKTKKIVCGKTIWKKGACFGLAYCLIASVPGMFITLSTFQVSLLMVLSWAVTGLVEAVVAGVILAKMNA
jgi:hypothetical protein